MPPQASAGEISLIPARPWSAAQRLRLHLVSGFRPGFAL